MFDKLVNQLKNIKLNRYDKIAITLYFIIIVVYIAIGSMTVLTAGGLILMGGAFFTYKGKMFLAVTWYLLADFCWVINAIQINDFQGAIFVTVGIMFGAIASFKMKNGHMESELRHRLEIENENTDN